MTKLNKKEYKGKKYKSNKLRLKVNLEEPSVNKKIPKVLKLSKKKLKKIV